MSEKAAIVGRFQPLHKGHKKMIENFQDRYELEIVIGSAGKEETEENPLSFEERKSIIERCFPDLEIKGLEDSGKDEEGNTEWRERLEEKVEGDKIISQNSLVKKIVENSPNLEIIEQKMYQPEIYSGTEVRRRIKSGEEWRYLVPRCAEDKIKEHEQKIKDSGTKYEFTPGWKKENIQN